MPGYHMGKMKKAKSKKKAGAKKKGGYRRGK